MSHFWEGRGCRVGVLCYLVSLQAKDNRIRLPSHAVCLGSLLHAPSHGIWGWSSTGGRQGQRREHMSPGKTREKILFSLGQTCSPAL